MTATQTTATDKTLAEFAFDAQAAWKYLHENGELGGERSASTRNVLNLYARTLNAESNFRDQLDAVARCAQSAVEGLDGGRSVNSLGVFQSTATMADAYAARYATLSDLLREALAAWRS